MSALNELESRLGLIQPEEAPVVASISPTELALLASPSFIYFDDVTAPAGGFAKVYAFGDSLSDAGNDYVATLGQVPSAPYSDGRFSNGNVWVQDLAQNLGLPPLRPSLEGGTDYAYGGAQTGTTSVHPQTPLDLPSQLAQFDLNRPNPSPNALYTVWAGSNDVMAIANSTETAAQQVATVQQSVNNEVQFIGGLVAHGAKDLVVMGVPDLGVTPDERASPASDAASSALAQDYNADLGTALRQIVASGGASIDYVNTYALLDAAVANPAAYGFSNVTQPVWTGGPAPGSGGSLNAAGAAQNGYLFFDDLHPTAAGHALLAAAVTSSLTGTA
ncbi:SGNH/GDSL hydrolase family protein [Acidisphaera sp. S103]|uniref:SGNH/GDSL hydrolase family protein n=1 Tax=Acidisphaera sp. S103 TaxID=1747223 RepID=UPI00131BCABF|nr:SGNH/GDSL hydrolase family protein [Acidisphaera sp. S103]